MKIDDNDDDDQCNIVLLYVEANIGSVCELIYKRN